MKNKNIFSIVVVIIFLVIGFILIKNNFSKNLVINQISYVKIAGKNVKVDLALTSKDQEQGLSGREILKEDEGMLFVFDHLDKYSFWMKDMNFPLDIIWINNDLQVVYIEKNAKPESYPKTFTPTQNTRYVLEVNALFSEKNNLKVGDPVEFLSS